MLLIGFGIDWIIVAKSNYRAAEEILRFSFFEDFDVQEQNQRHFISLANTLECILAYFVMF